MVELNDTESIITELYTQKQDAASVRLKHLIDYLSL